MHPLLTEWWSALRRIVARPRSLEQLLTVAVGGMAVLAIAALALGAGGLLREQASDQALARVRAAGLAARDEIRRLGEDAVASARVLAARPALPRLLAAADATQLQLFLRRFCGPAGADACAVYAGGQLAASTGAESAWPAALAAADEQGDFFMLPGTRAEPGRLGAAAAVPEAPAARVLVLRLFDARLAAQLSARAGVEIRLLPITDWLEAVEGDFRDLHSTSLANGQVAVSEVPGRALYASSTPVLAATGEGIALVEARLPAAEVSGAVDRFVRRLTVTTIVLAALALVLAILLARRIGRPLQALAEAAGRLGRGDFSAAIPAEGTQEAAALARTMDEMRRNLIELTGALRRREAEARALLAGVVEGVFAVDADRRIRYLNAQAAKMLGADAAALIGQFCGDALKPCAVNGLLPCENACPIVAARAEGRAQATEELEMAGGRRMVVITSAAPTDGLQVQVMRDETELEAVRRARDMVLANISHEFRTPLAAQLASVELVLDGLEDMPRERISEILTSLQRSTLRLTRLIDNLLESIRIESGQLSIRRQTVQLAQVVEDAEALIEGLLAQRRQALVVELPNGLPPVDGDAQRLTQVVTNLLANASKFGPEDSDIRIGARAMNGSVSLWIDDRGPGLPEPAGASIFERFYRASDQEPEPRGLGLGLWIVKSIVDRHGGSVAASRTGDGCTRFTVTLPAGKVAA
ncbi:MAG: ATP-binding protein [Gammaproteobacteria bacterium]